MSKQKNVMDSVRDDELNHRIKEKLDGLRLAIECEQVVINHLQPFRELFMKGDGSERSVMLGRRIHQLIDSEKLVRDWKQEISDIESLCEAFA